MCVDTYKIGRSLGCSRVRSEIVTFTFIVEIGSLQLNRELILDAIDLRGIQESFAI